MENIVAYAISATAHNVPADIRKLFEKSIYVSIMQDARQDDALDELQSIFNSKQIKHMVLKGYIIKSLYPSPDMRTMGDIDILLQLKQSKEEKGILSSLGYQITFENMREYNCVRDRR